MGPRLRRSLLVGMAAVSLVVAAQSPPATAAIDQTPPNLTVNIKPLFVVGSVVDRDTTFPVEYAVNIAQLIQWSATDNVGVCSYDLFDYSRRVRSRAAPAVLAGHAVHVPGGRLQR